ncbi:helix-turn-helix domain-containing protein [Pseudotabrizicola algicola]|nr:helix-turn-helix domain-containing protein [Pseudotabrizicola algicola]
MFTMGRSTVNDAGEIIERLKARFRVDSDSDLAAKLMISRSSVANWRNRNSVPDRYQRVAEGDINWSAFSTGIVDMSLVESAAMRLAMLRLMRDFGDIAKDYRAFLERSGQAAATWPIYWSKACKDVQEAMAESGSDDAFNIVSLIAYDEVFAAK